MFVPHNQQQQQQLESSRTMAALESIVSRQRNFCSLAKAARGDLKTELAVATRMLHQSGQRGNGFSAAVAAAAVAAEEHVAEALDESDGENEAP